MNRFIASNSARPVNADCFPATEISKKLNLPVGFVQKYCNFARVEWRYTSTFNNSTIYYDLDVIRKWRDGVFSFKLPIKYAIDEWLKENAQAEKKLRTWENCRVEWIEWGQLRAIKYEQLGCKIVEMSDTFVKIIGPKAFRKKKTAKGFSAFDSMGQRINFLAKTISSSM